jgi:hemolysin activation/secretion protein
VAPYLNQELDAGQLVELRDSEPRVRDAWLRRLASGDSGSGRRRRRDRDPRAQRTVGRISVEGTERLDPTGSAAGSLAGRAPLDRDALLTSSKPCADPQVARIAAELKPGDAPDEVDLDVRIVEAPATSVEVHGANDVSPALGGAAGGLNVARWGLLGRSDLFTASFDAGRGLGDYAASYSFPVHPSGTELEAHVQRTDSHIVEQPFADLDVDSHYRGYGFALRQPSRPEPPASGSRRAALSKTSC